MNNISDSDHPYKRLFSHKEMMADFITGFLHPDFASACDFQTLKRCNGSYVTDDLREREDDLIWSVRYGDRTLVIYLLIEFQSAPDPTMPVRIMSYMALLWQDLIRTARFHPGDHCRGSFRLCSTMVRYHGQFLMISGRAS